jgi:hypothetical protein
VKRRDYASISAFFAIATLFTNFRVFSLVCQKSGSNVVVKCELRISRRHLKDSTGFALKSAPNRLNVGFLTVSGFLHRIRPSGTFP